jgi:hypothetical protein
LGNFLLEPAYWNWLLVGLVLVIVEVLAPGTFFLWLGIAALGVAGVLVVFPELDWRFQWALFPLLSMGTIGAWWLISRHHDQDANAAGLLLNRRGQQYVGRVFTLDRPIVNGQGRLRVDDSSWKIQGQDCPAATRVRVIGADGIVLQVEREKS